MLGGVYGAYVRSLSVDLRSSHNTLLYLFLRLVSKCLQYLGVQICLI